MELTHKQIGFLYPNYLVVIYDKTQVKFIVSVVLCVSCTVVARAGAMPSIMEQYSI